MHYILHLKNPLISCYEFYRGVHDNNCESRHIYLWSRHHWHVVYLAGYKGDGAERGGGGGGGEVRPLFNFETMHSHST